MYSDVKVWGYRWTTYNALMGMFVTIKLNEKCPHCGGSVEWQTKNLTIDEIYPVANFGQKYEINSRMSAEVYTYCDKCKKEVNLKIEKGKIGA